MSEEKENQTVICPICKCDTSTTAKFCPECGTRQSAVVVDPNWVAAIHEKIKHARDNNIYYTVLATIGGLAAILIPFLMRFVLKYTMDMTSWLLTVFGILMFLGSYIGILVDDRKMRNLFKELERGPSPK